MHHFLPKLLLCCAPFLNGITFKLYQAAGVWRLPYINVQNLVFSCFALLFLILFKYLFGPAYKGNSNHINATWFDFKIPHIPSLFFLMPYVASCALLPFLESKSFLDAFLRTVIVGVFYEELLCRGIFIKYPDMTNKEFPIWAILTSSTFALNHWFMDLDYGLLAYVEQVYKFVMHFTFGIILAGISFKSKKIELSLIRHSVSNLQVYLFRYNPVLGTCNFYFWHLMDYFSLIGLDTRKNESQ